VLVVGATAVIQHALRGGKASPWLAGLLNRAHRLEDDAYRGSLQRNIRSHHLGRRGLERSARHGEQLNCSRAEPMPELARK
jgi:hypothetical protein